MTSIEHRQSVVIESMRFPLILLVLYNHMLLADKQTIEWNFSGWNCYYFLSEMISHNLAAFNITFYFLISGFFFVRSMPQWEQNSYYKKIKKRAKSLLVPYFVWIVIMIIATIATSTLINAIWPGRNMELLKLQQTSLFQIFWGEPFLYSLWFVRVLMCMTILTPVCYYFCKYTKIYGILLLMLLYISGIESHVPGFGSTAIFLYTLGVYLGMNRINLLELCTRYKRSSIIGALIFLCVATLFNGTPYHIHLMRMLALIEMIAFVNIFNVLICNERIKNILSRLSVTTFFVYVIHQIYIIEWMKGALSRSILVQSPGGMIAGYLLTPCLCALVCLGIYAFLRKLSPSLVSFLTGGRMKPFVPIKK